MTQSAVIIQIAPVSAPSTPSWLGEVAAFAQVLAHLGLLKAIQERVRFARARFGHYDLIDFVVVLIGYAVSGEPTLLAFYERLLPFAELFMALFGRNLLPHRSTLSRFLAALDQPTVEVLRTLFLEDLLVRKPFASPGGLFDRTGEPWLVVDVDGTRQAARQRALPQIESLPAPHRCFEAVCAPGYQGRKRGEVVRTRTVILQAHTHQFLGTFGGPGNGDYRGELLRAIQVSTHPESRLTRALYDCPAVPLTPTGPEVRLVVATHALTSSPPKVGVERDGTVYELFVSTLPSPAFTASDVLDLYLHRGSFETVLADEDDEQNSDRWYSHTPCGQEFCQILAQWVWNLRLELGQKLSPSGLRTAEFAKAVAVPPEPIVEPAPVSKPTPQVPYGSPQWARPSWTSGFPGSTFTQQPDGTLRCPANHPLYPQERRPERDGSLRVLYAARISHCRGCPLRSQCQESSSSVKPRRVSAVLCPRAFEPSDASPPLEGTPLPLPLAPLLWKDWSRCHIRRAWLKIMRSETVRWEISATLAPSPATTVTEEVSTRAQRAHWRLSWDQRLARNARPPDASRLSVTLHGLSAPFAHSFGFEFLATA